jgi:hypothetical protein
MASRLDAHEATLSPSNAQKRIKRCVTRMLHMSQYVPRSLVPTLHATTKKRSAAKILHGLRRPHYHLIESSNAT